MKEVQISRRQDDSKEKGSFILFSHTLKTNTNVISMKYVIILSYFYTGHDIDE